MSRVANALGAGAQAPAMTPRTISSGGGGMLSGIPIIGNIVDTLIQGHINKKAAQREFKYNMDMMKYQNEYNSPAQQMKRLEEAGLNPNLVYGSGGITGNMTDTATYNEQPAQSNISGGLTAGLGLYLQDRMQKVQIDNVKASTNAILTKSINDAMMGENIKLDTLLKSQELSQKTRNEDWVVDVQKHMAELSKINVANALKTGQLRDEEINNKSLMRGLITAQINLANVSAREKEEYVKLLQQGINPHGSAWERIALKIADKLGIGVNDIPQAFENASEKIDQYKKDPEQFKKDFKKYKGNNEFSLPWQDGNFWYEQFH